MHYAQYQVVGHAAHATVDGPHGRIRTLLMRGALVPGDAPEVPHLLSVGLIAPVGQAVGETAPAPTSTAVAGGTPGEGSETPAGSGQQAAPDGQSPGPDPEVEEKRAAARAKLPTDGTAPDGRAGQAVWVEYLVTKGYDYDALKNEEKDALRDLASNQ